MIVLCVFKTMNGCKVLGDFRTARCTNETCLELLEKLKMVKNAWRTGKRTTPWKNPSDLKVRLAGGKGTPRESWRTTTGGTERGGRGRHRADTHASQETQGQPAVAPYAKRRRNPTATPSRSRQYRIKTGIPRHLSGTAREHTGRQTRDGPANSTYGTHQ